MESSTPIKLLFLDISIKLLKKSFTTSIYKEQSNTGVILKFQLLHTAIIKEKFDKKFAHKKQKNSIKRTSE